MTAPAATLAIPHRHMRSSARMGTLVLGDPIVIGHGTIATSHGGAPWAGIGDRLIVAAAGGALAIVEVASMRPDGNPIVSVVCGELALGPVHVMRGPMPGDSRPVVRRGVVRRPVSMPGAPIAAMVRHARLEAGDVR
jgi:hypothetical protein